MAFNDGAASRAPWGVSGAPPEPPAPAPARHTGHSGRLPGAWEERAPRGLCRHPRRREEPAAVWGPELVAGAPREEVGASLKGSEEFVH